MPVTAGLGAGTWSIEGSRLFFGHAACVSPIYKDSFVACGTLMSLWGAFVADPGEDHCQQKWHFVSLDPEVSNPKSNKDG